LEITSDKHQYLHFTSSHPETVKASIPFGIATRIKRICSDDETYQKRKSEVISNLSKRGYKKDHIERQLRLVDKRDRQTLLKSQTNCKRNTTRVPLVITFFKTLPNIHKITRKHLNTLYKSDHLKGIFNEPPIVAYRRDTNMQDMLVNRKHNNTFYKYQSGTELCNKNCAICKIVIETKTFKGTDGQVYNIDGHIDCKTENLIYGIYCGICQKIVYVGETGNSLYTRMQNHLSTIRKITNDPVPLHFNSVGHTIGDFKVIGIEKIKTQSHSYRSEKEKFWIKKVNTLDSNGLNKREK